MADNVEQLHPPVPALDGSLDAFAEGKVFGWAWDRERPTDRLEVELWCEDAVVASGVADRRRADLAGSGIGDGAYAFEIDLPEGVSPDGLTVLARSPSSGKTVELTLRPAPELNDVPEELQRVGSALHGLALAQKQTAGVVVSALRELRDEQRDLGKRLETVEVFLTRFDTLLRQLDEKLASQPPADKPRLNRSVTLRVGAILFLVAVATATALIL